jgi:hypothetical protein
MSESKSYSCLRGEDYEVSIAVEIDGDRRKGRN